MAKLVDVPDLGSGAARRVGSSPIIRTKNSNQQWLEFFYLGVPSAKASVGFSAISFIPLHFIKGCRCNPLRGNHIP